MTRGTRLELTWVGKYDQPRLEPRILLEDTEMSYCAKERVGEDDRFDNLLIKGDNLLALKALEHQYAGKVKCIYIDPPFNTKQAFEHYDDGFEHSTWLRLMRARIQCIYRLMALDATLFVHIDDNELAYLIVLMDEIFGRENRQSVVTFKQGAPTGHKAINPGCVSVSNFLLIYSRSKADWRPNRIFTARGRDDRYGQFIDNYEEDWGGWTFSPLMKAFAREISLSPKDAKKAAKEDPERLEEFVMRNAHRVIRFAQPDYDAVSEAARGIIDSSRADPTRVYLLNREGQKDMYIRNGDRILFYEDKLKLVDGKKTAAEPLTTIWDDLLSNNLHNEGGVDFPKGKKPEALIKRCVELASHPGDLVLDSFAGSGTAGAVAHKMGRRWIMVELGEHCDTHIVPRLRKVIDGADPGGVTEATGWKGGGGFRYCTLAPSLLEQDERGQWIISKQYNAAMLAEAVCTHEGFSYAPSKELYWLHGVRRDSPDTFLWVTTQTLTRDRLERLSAEVGEGRHLMVSCLAFKGDAGGFPNLVVKKLPTSILDRCEWGKDDYSLKIAALGASAVPEPPADDAADAPIAAPKKKGKKAKDAEPAGQGVLFGGDTKKDG